MTELFCIIHDFWKYFEDAWKQRLIDEGKSAPRRTPGPHSSEVMTIMILFHRVGYRNFKTFYNTHILVYLCKEFPNCPSYSRFVELKKSMAASKEAIFSANDLQRKYFFDMSKISSLKSMLK